MHFATWQNQRSHVVSQGNQRFLYQTSQPAAGTGATATDDDDGLGPLPDGKRLINLKPWLEKKIQHLRINKLQFFQFVRLGTKSSTRQPSVFRES